MKYFLRIIIEYDLYENAYLMEINVNRTLTFDQWFVFNSGVMANQTGFCCLKSNSLCSQDGEQTINPDTTDNKSGHKDITAKPTGTY